MQPVKTEKSNFVYKGPTEDIADLPCERVQEIYEGASGENRVHRAVYSVWEPTDEERQAIADGANVKLGILGMEPIPPVSVEVADESRT